LSPAHPSLCVPCSPRGTPPRRPKGLPKSKAPASRIRGCYRASGRRGFANPKRESHR